MQTFLSLFPNQSTVSTIYIINIWTLWQDDVYAISKNYGIYIHTQSCMHTYIYILAAWLYTLVNRIPMFPYLQQHDIFLCLFFDSSHPNEYERAPNCGFICISLAQSNSSEKNVFYSILERQFISVKVRFITCAQPLVIGIFTIIIYFLWS